MPLIPSIIGLSAAHYLSCLSPGLAIHLLHSSPSLFASASGKAGGFLARDWFRSATASPGVLSFDLHRQLAEEHDGRRRWGYSPSTAISLPEARVPPGGKKKKGEDRLPSATAAAVTPSVACGGKRCYSPVRQRHILGNHYCTTVRCYGSLNVTQFLTMSQKSAGAMPIFARNVHVHHPVTVPGIVS
jgi:hypothetical protein